MVIRRILLLTFLLLTCPAGHPARLVAATAPPDWLTPRPINTCTKSDGAADACIDGDLRLPDAAVDGQTVVFVSRSNRLVPDDRNRAFDVFVWHAGTVARVSVTAQGVEGNYDSDRAAISGDGRYVYFRSFADSLITGTAALRANLYLKDLVTGKLLLVSRDAAGAPLNETSITEHFEDIDTDYRGRFVVFASTFSNFVAGSTDINFVQDIFLADVDPDGNGDYFDHAPRLYLLSARADGLTTGNGPSFAPTIAQHGGAAAWLTRATDLKEGLASNGPAADVLLARFATRPEGGVDPAVRTITAINRMEDGVPLLTPQGARLARLDPWRDQVAFVTADAIPGTGDDHAGEDVYLSIGDGTGGDARQIIWMSDGYSTTAPSALMLAWDPRVPPAATSQVAWVAQDDARTVADLLLQRAAPHFPVGWSVANWVDAVTPSSAPVETATLSADGRFAIWTTTESYGLDVPPDSINLFRRAIAPAHSVPLTVQAVGGGANFIPPGVPIDAPLAGTRLYSPTQVVTLTPRADVGYRFNAWVGVDASAGMTATVIVYGARTVTATFDAMTRPVAAPVLITTMEETAVDGITLAISDPDPDEAHTITLAQPPNHGTASVSNNVARYQPAPNFSGQDEFALQVTDAYGLQLAQAAVVMVDVMPVADMPVAADLTLTVTEDTPLPIALAINDPDVGDMHTVTLVNAPDHGTAAVNETIITYQPAPNFHGKDGLALQVTDAAGLTLAAPAQVTITVISVNDPPVFASAQGRGENTGAAILVPVTVLDVDVEDSHSLTVEKPPAFGDVRVITGMGVEPRAAPETFAYTPMTGFAGVDTFTFRVTDSSNASITATAVVTVTRALTEPVPTPAPTAMPTTSPTTIPTAEPTSIPTTLPTAIPTTMPTSIPTAIPTSMPTAAPTALPTALPTDVPTPLPTPATPGLPVLHLPALRRAP